jgi:ATP-dependent helicase/nuclease subunit A
LIFRILDKSEISNQSAMRGFSMVDADARAAIKDDLDATIVVEAAAGTGKTTELVQRILRVLSTGRARMVDIVAVTFTEKAAGELKLRLREALEQDRAAATEADVRARLEDALQTLEEAHVNTIHGFCAELLRERPVEARVDPLFTVLTEPQADALYARAFRRWLQDRLEDPPEGLRRALRRTSAPGFYGADSQGPIDRLRAAGRQLADTRDYPHPWRRPPFNRQFEIERLVAQLHELADLSAASTSDRDSLYIDTDAVRRLSRQIRLETSFHEATATGPRGSRSGRPGSPPAPAAVSHSSADLDGWEARLVDLTRDRGFSRTRKGSGYKYGKDVTRSAVLSARDSLFAELQEFRRLADADLAASLQHELAGATESYQALKETTGALDFADLLTRARHLIKNNAGVRGYLQRKFVRIFVDEFQDTDPVQAEILLLLAADDPSQDDPALVNPVPGKLFIVGDPKQAIYRFRGTDVSTYRRVSRHLELHGGRIVQLTTSYRSVPAIQRFVNAAFSVEMCANEHALQPDYVPLAPYRAADDSQPAIVALPVPKPYGRSGYFRPSAMAIEQSLPDAVGAFIEWIIDPKNGWTVAERTSDGSETRVPLQPRHVAVLFRRFVSFGADVTREYVDAIEARGIPHLLVGGKAFHGREEVETIRAALAAIEWPDDELSVFASLRGSLFAIDDEQLLEFRHRFDRFHPFRIPKELGGNSGDELMLTAEQTSHLMPIADALRLLQRLHRLRNYRPVADTIGRLLAETRAHVGFVLRPAGEQALANVLHVAELARQYEQAGGISFRGFIDELRSAAEGEAAEAPILEEGSDGVRLMTVHKAKGLEFPVVILADLTCRMSRNDASRYLDASRGLCALKIGGWAPHELYEHEADEVARDQAEGVRLAYVAATRARDLLVVPAVGDDAWEGGWFAPLNRAIYPPMNGRRQASRGPKCPAFKSKDSVLQRPDGEPARPATVCPGRHQFSDYSVVWWDPAALALGATPPFGVRRGELIVKDVPKHVVGDGRSRYDRWQLARIDARAAGSVPSIRAETVHEWTSRPSGENEVGLADPSTVQILHVRRTDDRPRGARFGSLVHAVLGRTPFDAGRQTIDDLADIEARILGLDDEEAKAAAAVVEQVLRHGVIARAHAANVRGMCRRETPITHLLPNGTLLEGVVDLAFEHEGTWTVVDYKTDHEIEAVGEERYRRQVAMYAAAISTAADAPCNGMLLVI